MRNTAFLACAVLGLGLGLAPFASSCGGGTPPCDEKCCTAGADIAKRCGNCNLGEVSVPLSRCEPRDAAGNTCGDGLYQSALEQCDPTAAVAPACTAPAMCTSCMCVTNNAVCGDGTINGAEACERNSDCGAMVVCRKCQCALASDRVIFEDATGDVPATQVGLTIERFGLEIDSGDDDLVSFGLGDPSGVRGDKPSEICWVIVIDASTEQRLCLNRTFPGPYTMTVKTDGGPLRPLVAPDGRLIDETNLTQAIRFKTSVGLRTEPALTFFVEVKYDGLVIDRLPDTGTVSFQEIFGE